MNCFVGVTDYDWFRFLSGRPDLDEVNFWQPSGNVQFRALERGGLFLFKLHAPRNFIAGGGFFAHFSILPYRMAWEFFGESNGASSLVEMRTRIEKYRRDDHDPYEDYEIGCIILTSPFFFDEANWIPTPRDWAPNIVRGKGYDLTEGIGRELWDQVQQRLAAMRVEPGIVAESPETEIPEEATLPGFPQPPAAGGAGGQLPADLFGEPTLVRPRLGQGAFRTVITDTYERRCAVTGERALPVLEAAHIRPVSEGGQHEVDNGLLLRSDLHRLFDRGYVTVTPDYTFHVSRRLKDDFDNGEPYYPLQGEIWTPPQEFARPNREFLEWHADTVFRR